MTYGSLGEKVLCSGHATGVKVLFGDINAQTEHLIT